jgi:hypothetical protein
MPNGVMAFVCPADLVDHQDVRRHFISFYTNVTVVPFPEEHRPFNEVIMLAHKRERPGSHGQEHPGWRAWESVHAPLGFRYRIPPGNGPRLFEKIEPTWPELQRMLTNSPLRSHLKAPVEASLPSPPLPLGVGHVALLLASGQLDGVVSPEGAPPHVVRGTSRKHEFVADVTDTPNQDGSTTTRTTISERIELILRTVDQTGRIRSFGDTASQQE